MAMLVYQRVYSMLLLIREFAQNTSMCQEARIKMDPKGWLVEMTYIQIMSLRFFLFHLISLWWSQSRLIIQIEIVYSIQFHIVTFILTSIHTHTYVHIHTHTYIRTHTDIHACMHACIHMYIHTDKYTHIHIITDVLCMLGISHGHDLNSLYRGNRVSWSFAHGVSCLFFAHDLQETKGWRAAISELQDSMIRPPTQGTFRQFAQAPKDQWYQWFRQSMMICIANPIHHLWHVYLHVWRAILALLCQSFRSIGSSMYKS